jgi:hypothetical protein
VLSVRPPVRPSEGSGSYSVPVAVARSRRFQTYGSHEDVTISVV